MAMGGTRVVVVVVSPSKLALSAYDGAVQEPRA